MWLGRKWSLPERTQRTVYRGPVRLHCSLTARADDGGAEWGWVHRRQVIKGALQAVAQCHARGIILRDVKPHNFLFLNSSPDSPLKVTDFGLADDFDPRRPDAEPFEERVGTGAVSASVGGPAGCKRAGPMQPLRSRKRGIL